MWVTLEWCPCLLDLRWYTALDVTLIHKSLKQYDQIFRKSVTIFYVIPFFSPFEVKKEKKEEKRRIPQFKKLSFTGGVLFQRKTSYMRKVNLRKYFFRRILEIFLILLHACIHY